LESKPFRIQKETIGEVKGGRKENGDLGKMGLKRDFFLRFEVLRAGFMV